MPKPLIFFLLLSVFPVSSVFSKTSDGSKALASNCSSHVCGGVIIRYPFWLTSNTTSNQYCGYPGFNLSCSNEENTIINLGGDSYHVQNISYTDYTLTLVDVAVTANQTCPRALHNVTIRALPLSYNRRDLNLSFYFNCSPGIVWYPEAPPNATECLSSKDKDSFVFVNGTEPVALIDYWHHFCEEKVVVAVMESEIDANNSLNERFGGVMKGGFVLDWRQAPSCGACEESIGLCGFDNTNDDFLCFCSDGSTRTNDTCKATSFFKEKVVVTVMDSEIGANNSLIKGFGGALNEGSVLDWRPPPSCGPCEASMGLCRFDNPNEDFLCFCSDGSTRTNDTCKGRSKLALILGTVVSAVGILIIALFYIIVKKLRQSESIFFWKTKTENYRNIEAFLKNCGSFCPKKYTYSDIKKITNSFRTKLGQGGFGCVYEGQLENGRLVAVKVLKGSKGNGDEFINEVATISRTSHVHIVSFLGFCFEGRHRALVYEFMPNGSLDKFIHNGGSLTNNQLGWEALFQIAVGIARGLEYLHRGCNTRILHFDIKPHNILLNEDFCPKISDFGLAKLCPQKDSIVSLLGTRGTPGYIAPEVFNRNFGGVSHKSDVYSYGMMVLEMVGQRKNNMSVEVDRTSENYFPHWVYKRLELDEELGSHGITSEEANASVRKMIIVGLWCIQIDPSHRPSMSRVLEMLEGSLESLQIPPKPFFSSPSRAPIDSSTTQSTLMS